MGPSCLPNRRMDAPVKPEHDGVLGVVSFPAFASHIPSSSFPTRTAVRDPRRAWRSSKRTSGDLWNLAPPLRGRGTQGRPYSFYVVTHLTSPRAAYAASLARASRGPDYTERSSRSLPP